MKIIKSLTVGRACLAAFACFSLFAASPLRAVTQNFTTSADGNLYTSKVFGSITVTAQSSSNGSYSGGSPTLASAQIGWYSGGLGATTSGESTSSPYHAVDNNSGYERVVFDFGVNTILDKVSLDDFSSGNDNDISVYYYNGSSWVTLVGPNDNDPSSPYGDRIVDVNAGNISATKWAIGAAVPAVSPTDYFKISSVEYSTSTPQASTPDNGSTLLLLGITIAGLFVKKNRKNGI